MAKSINEEVTFNCCYCGNQHSLIDLRIRIRGKNFCSNECVGLFEHKLILNSEEKYPKIVQIDKTQDFELSEKQFLREIYSYYLPFDVKVKQINYKSNYNGNEFGILNSVYPLYKMSDISKVYWQGTCTNNPTGQPLKDLKLCLIPIEKLLIMEENDLKKKIASILFYNQYTDLLMYQKSLSYVLRNLIWTNSLSAVQMIELLKLHIDIFGVIDLGYGLDKTIL